MARIWKKFEIGDKPIGAGVEILDVLIESSVQSRQLYQVRLLCCGHERNLYHHAIMKRQNEKPDSCVKCRGTGGGENRGIKLNSRFVDAPWWMAPESVLARVRPGWRWS